MSMPINNNFSVYSDFKEYSNLGNKIPQYNTQNIVGGGEKLDEDTFVPATNPTNEPIDKYAADDGKISTTDKIKNFAKGVLSPITSMFSSPKNFALGALAIAGSTLLIVGTGGAAAPFLVAAGLTGGCIQFGKSAYNAATATTDEEARQAWQGMGSGTLAIAGSVAGAKGALKTTGVDTTKMNVFQATAKCIKSTPKSISNSVKTVSSGQFMTNITEVLKTNKTIKSTQKEQNIEIKDDIPDTEIQLEEKAEPIIEKVEPKNNRKIDSESKTKVEDIVNDNTTVTKNDSNPYIEVKSGNDGSKIIEYKNKNGEFVGKRTITNHENNNIVVSKLEKADGTVVESYFKDGKLTAQSTLKNINGELQETNFVSVGENNQITKIDCINEKIQKINLNDENKQWISIDKNGNPLNSETVEQTVGNIKTERKSTSETVSESVFNIKIDKEQMEADFRCQLTKQFEKEGFSGIELDNAVNEVINSEIGQSIIESGYTLDTMANGHAGINGFNPYLRKKGKYYQAAEANAKALDIAFEHLKPTTEDFTVYRGVHGFKLIKADQQYLENLCKMESGQIIKDKGFVYSSFDDSVAKCFAGIDTEHMTSAIMKIKVPKGSKVSYSHYSEQAECLFPRNAEFKILNKSVTDNGLTQFELEYVLPQK